MNTRTLGRVPPPDFDHITKYALADLPQAERPKNVPVAIGIPWFTGFDQPVHDGDGYWIMPHAGSLGVVRGGHAVCLEPKASKQHDTKGWYEFYDQGQEGACEGFAHSRMMSLLNRKKYDGFWLYDQARKLDGGGAAAQGTTNRSALEVLRTKGHSVITIKTNERDDRGYHGTRPELAEGIAAYRWARTVDEILAALGTPDRDYVTLLNSWGVSYPQRVHMPAEILDELLRQDGEAGIVTDR